MTKLTAITLTTAAFMVVIGTVATANKVRTGRHGPTAPRELVQAFADPDYVLIERMRAYVRSFAKK